MGDSEKGLIFDKGDVADAMMYTTDSTDTGFTLNANFTPENMVITVGDENWVFRPHNNPQWVLQEEADLPAPPTPTAELDAVVDEEVRKLHGR